MPRRGIGRWGKHSESRDEPSMQASEEERYNTSGWEQEEVEAAYEGDDLRHFEGYAAPGEEAAALAHGGEDASAAGFYADEGEGAYDAEEDLPGAGDEEEWYEDDQEENAEERALMPYEAPQPPGRRSFLSAALLRLAGEGRELALLEPRATGPVLVPGSGKIAQPGSFGHSPLSLRAQRPRPFFMFVTILMLALMTLTATAWAATPLDRQIQAYNAFTTFAGIGAPPVATSQPKYNWYVVHYGDTLQSIADRFHVQPNGILLMNGLQDADQLYVGMSLKIPTDPEYGKGVQVGVPDIPTPPPDKAGNIYGTNPWNSTSGATIPDPTHCAPAGDADTLAHRQAFQLAHPNPNSGFVRGFTWYHNGVDLSNPAGVPILAAQAGLVLFAGWDPLGLGWSVKINHCNGLSTMYGHMQNPPMVKAGDYVSVGQQIGQEGSTGNSTGPHLHFMTEWWNQPANPYCFDFKLPAGDTPCTS